MSLIARAGLVTPSTRTVHSEIDAPGAVYGEIVEIFEDDTVVVKVNGGLLLVTEYEYSGVPVEGQVLGRADD